MWNKLWQKIKAPSVKMLVFAYPITAICILWTVVMLMIDPKEAPLQIAAYVSYALAAIMLAYSVYTVVATRVVQRLVRWGKLLLKSKPMTEKLLEDYDFRTLFFSAFSFFLTVAYALYNGVIAVMGVASVWHGGLCGYYLLLVGMRVGVLYYRKRERDGKTERTGLIEVRKFRNCGILLTLAILALSVIILQMVREGAGFEKAGLMIYVTAAYTAVKTGMSIRNFLKARRTDDYTLQTLRNVNLADGAVSVLALQTAMFASFGAEGVDTALFNAWTGAGVCLIVLSLGIYMIVKGNMQIKKWRE